ncbi:MAG: histidine phosphatase family protein, partial [Chloroflexi bacterium]|nr:histidine phosphatase family protein [Chloroflexota bacterium]
AEQWTLSDQGRELAQKLAALPILANLQTVWSSPEPKAQATAQPLADLHSAAFLIHPHLSELQRGPSNLPDRETYEAAVRQAFANPTTSSGGWERACDTQQRIVTAVSEIAAQADGPVAIVSHGLILSLLVAHLRGETHVDTAEWRAIPLPALAVMDRETWQLIVPFESVKTWKNKTFI